MSFVWVRSLHFKGVLDPADFAFLNNISMRSKSKMHGNR